MATNREDTGVRQTGSDEFDSRGEPAMSPGSDVAAQGSATGAVGQAPQRVADDVVEQVTDLTTGTVGDVTATDAFMIAEDVNVHYGENHAIRDVTLQIGRHEVLALIGPSGCGKSTFLRCLNRMNDTIESARVTGSITLDGDDIYRKSLDPVVLRARVGMVFQKPNPFPKSIYDNVAYGPRIHGLAADRTELDQIVHESLERAGLLKEVKDRMTSPAPACRAGSSSGCVSRARSR